MKEAPPAKSSRKQKKPKKASNNTPVRKTPAKKGNVKENLNDDGTLVEGEKDDDDGDSDSSDSDNGTGLGFDSVGEEDRLDELDCTTVPIRAPVCDPGPWCSRDRGVQHKYIHRVWVQSCYICSYVYGARSSPPA